MSHLEPVRWQPVGFQLTRIGLADPEENLRQTADRLGLANLNPSQLLQGFAAIINELANRGISRTKNNPVADYTEWLVASSLGLELLSNSTAGFDAHDSSGTRYQIKGRRTTRENRSTQLSAMRNLADRPFDFLIAVIYHADFSISYAARIPVDVVLEKATYRQHVNAHTLSVRSNIFEDNRVENITSLLET